MTFLETLQTHRGGLLRIKSELYWYDGRGPDGARGRVCLILDAARYPAARAAAATPTNPLPAALLLIDGCPQWIWVGREDVELIT